MEPREDKAVDEIRDIRRRISAECGHDLARLVERYMRAQEKYADRLLKPDPKPETPEQDAA